MARAGMTYLSKMVRSMGSREKRFGLLVAAGHREARCPAISRAARPAVENAA